MDDHYDILGVPPDASLEAIKKRFRFLAFAYHPDRFVNASHGQFAEEAFKKINEAYQILSNPSSRSHYDGQRAKSKTGCEEEHIRREQAEMATVRVEKTAEEERIREAIRRMSAKGVTDAELAVYDEALDRMSAKLRKGHFFWLAVYFLPVTLLVVGVAGVGLAIAVYTADHKLCNPQCQVQRASLLKKINIDFPINIPSKTQSQTKKGEPKEKPVLPNKVIQDRIRANEQAREQRAEEIRTADLEYRKQEAQRQEALVQAAQKQEALREIQSARESEELRLEARQREAEMPATQRDVMAAFSVVLSTDNYKQQLTSIDVVANEVERRCSNEVLGLPIKELRDALIACINRLQP